MISSDDLWEMGFQGKWDTGLSLFPFGYFQTTRPFLVRMYTLFYNLISKYLFQQHLKMYYFQLGCPVEMVKKKMDMGLSHRSLL